MSTPAPDQPAPAAPRPKRYTFECRRCGESHATNVRTQVMCSVCRIVEDFEYWDTERTHPDKCRQCGAQFLRWHRSHILCADCEPRKAGCVATCKVCEHPDLATIHPQIDVCLWCAKDTDKLVRGRIIHGLQKGRPARPGVIGGARPKKGTESKAVMANPPAG